MTDRRFWQDKRVLLTGHTGFKGAWLSIWLHRMGAKLTGYALAPDGNGPSLFTDARVDRLLKDQRGDIGDLEGFSAIVAETCPEIVIHMAAQSLVRQSYSTPVETFATNVMGTANVLEALRRTRTARAVLVVTSDKCYENREWDRGYTESDALGGYDPYSASKAGAELVVGAYRRSFFDGADAGDIAVASVRAGNVIGGGDWAIDRLVPDIIRAFAANARPRIRSPASIRPWQHVLEPLSGYLTLIERMWERPRNFSEAWNFGPTAAGVCTVGEVVEKLCRLWPDAPGWDLDNRPQSHEATRLTLDSTKACSRLGWQPYWSMDTALEKTVAGYRAHLSGTIEKVVCSQIDEYSDARPLTAL